MNARTGALLALLLVAIPFAVPAAAATSSAPARPAPARPRRSRVIGIKSPPPPLAAGDLISLDLKDADLRDVVRTFAQLAGRNVVIDPGVKGSVTVRLVDVRWEDALDVILRSNGLAMVEEGRMMRVATPGKLVSEQNEDQ